MNQLELNSVAFEVTRRCNIRCKHCMRGEAQNIDMTKEMVDAFFDTKSRGYTIKAIRNFCFTGGEPTLNPGIIVYTINKIIQEDIPVHKISMTTNGQIFVPELVEALNRFCKYRNLKIQQNDQLSLSELLEYSMDSNTRIIFSTDRFHKPIPEDIKKMYKTHAKGLRTSDYAVKDEDVVRTGFATFGKEFIPEDYLYHKKQDDYKIIFENVYMTAKGDITFGGEGSYEYIDNHIVGRVDQVSIFDSIEAYGKEIFPEKVKVK